MKAYAVYYKMHSAAEPKLSKFNGEIAKNRPIEGWSIDCLPCGYLRIFCNGWIEAGHSVSDFEIFYHDRSEKK